MSEEEETLERYRSALHRIWQHAPAQGESFHQALGTVQSLAEEAIRGCGPLVVPSGVRELIEAAGAAFDAVLPDLERAVGGDTLAPLKSALSDLRAAKLVPPPVQLKVDEDGKDVIVLEQAEPPEPDAHA